MTAPDQALSPAQAQLLDALRAADGLPRSSAQLIGWVGTRHGRWLARETVTTALNRLVAIGRAAYADRDAGTPRGWTLADTGVDQP
jgi:hypothetical protein